MEIPRWLHKSNSEQKVKPKRLEERLKDLRTQTRQGMVVHENLIDRGRKGENVKSEFYQNLISLVELGADIDWITSMYEEGAPEGIIKRVWDKKNTKASERPKISQES